MPRYWPGTRSAGTAHGTSRARGIRCPPGSTNASTRWSSGDAAVNRWHTSPGRGSFWGLDIAVTRDVLIPRPESELLVETAVALLVDRAAAWDVADVGTGSGCLAVALAREFRHARVTATDIAPAALVVAQRNATRHGVASRIRFHGRRGLDGLSGPYDLIVSNPPYVPEPDMAKLAPEVAGHEPASALCGGPDGLDPARELMPAVVARLRSGACLVMEIGAGQGAAVTEIVTRHPELTLVEIRPDLRDIPRVAVIRRNGGS